MEVLQAFWGRLVLLAGLLACSFFFSASESALFALSRRLFKAYLPKASLCGLSATTRR